MQARFRYMTLLAACAAAVAAAPAAGQEGAGRVTVTGQVVDRSTGQPLAAAEVAIDRLRRRAATDAEGRFRISGVPQGSWEVTVSRIGYAEAAARWQVDAERTAFRVALAPDPVVLESLRANVDHYERRRNAVATSVRVIPREQLARATAGTAYDVVANRGVSVVPCPGGALSFGQECIWHRGRPAAMSLVIDEMPAIGGLDQLRMYRPEELYMVEIYGGGRHVRVYTSWYMEDAARRRIRPRPVLY